MNINLIYNNNRFFALDENKSLIAEITFPFKTQTVVDINHTYVDPSLRGQGVADLLMQAAADFISKHSLKAITSCAYAEKWFEKHPDYQHLLD